MRLRSDPLWDFDRLVSQPFAGTYRGVLLSSGALTRGDAAAAVPLAQRAGADGIEISALHERELEAALDLATQLPGHLHGPTKGRALDERDLVARLAASRRDVVMHPDVFDQARHWQRLDRRLLVENTDQRKTTGQDPATLDVTFTALPDARMCLDLSHALACGGPRLVTTLARRYTARIALLHVGCPAGHHDPPATLRTDELSALHAVLAILGPTPVVLERPITQQPAVETAATLVAQVRAHTR